MKTRVKLVGRIRAAMRPWPLVFKVLLAPTLLASAGAQTAAPQLVDSNLSVRAVATGLTMPTSMAFIGANDILVLEKNSGRVVRVVNGTVQPTAVLDLAVNFGSE